MRSPFPQRPQAIRVAPSAPCPPAQSRRIYLEHLYRRHRLRNHLVAVICQKVDIANPSTPTINGVTFTNGTSSGTNWSLSGPTATYTGSGAGSVSGNVGGIVSDFVYNGNSEVLSFTGRLQGSNTFPR